MTDTTAAQPSPTTGFLTSVIISALAPVFFGVTGGDIPLARMAAEEVINEHRARNRVDLIAVGQIIATGLAALGSLGQSMNDDIPLPMALRLRTNAISKHQDLYRSPLIHPSWVNIKGDWYKGGRPPAA